MQEKISTTTGTIIILIIALTIGVFVWEYENDHDVVMATMPITPRHKQVEIVASAERMADIPKEVTIGASGESYQPLFPEMDPQEKKRLLELTKDWKTYHNNEYGYEFKYPNGYVIEKGKYEPGSNEINIISDGDCLDFGVKCDVTIRTLSSKDTRIHNMEKSVDVNLTKFSINDNNITYLPSDRLGAIIQSKKNAYQMISNQRPKIKEVFQGVYFTFKELQ